YFPGIDAGSPCLCPGEGNRSEYLLVLYLDQNLGAGPQPSAHTRNTYKGNQRLGIAGGELSEGRNNIEVGRQAYVYRARRNYFFKGTSSDLINRGVDDADELLLIGG